jgi:hypothetical protein
MTARAAAAAADAAAFTGALEATRAALVSDRLIEAAAAMDAARAVCQRIESEGRLLPGDALALARALHDACVSHVQAAAGALTAKLERAAAARRAVLTYDP